MPGRSDVIFRHGVLWFRGILAAASVYLVALSCPAVAGETGQSPVSITVAAAASLRSAFEDGIIPAFSAKYPWITVDGTYDGSGKLQIQIENGLDADVFMSAAMRQMEALVAKGFVASGSVRPLLENRLVLIRPAGEEGRVDSFSDVAKADPAAIGDPASVPAGQYAREVFAALGVWEAVKDTASFGTSVTEVLNWVAEGSADVGVVYATDAAATSRVTVICEAPPGVLKERILYPAGVLSGSRHKPEAEMLIDFLASEAALMVFEKFGFSPITPEPILEREP